MLSETGFCQNKTNCIVTLPTTVITFTKASLKSYNISETSSFMCRLTLYLCMCQGLESAMAKIPHIIISSLWHHFPLCRSWGWRLTASWQKSTTLRRTRRSKLELAQWLIRIGYHWPVGLFLYGRFSYSNTWQCVVASFESITAQTPDQQYSLTSILTKRPLSHLWRPIPP